MSVIETIIDIPAEHEKNVCGQFDSYLKKIERTLHVTMIGRDGALKIIGSEQMVQKAKSVFNNLIELSKRGNAITEQNVDYALSLSFSESDSQILEIDKDIICRTINWTTGKAQDPWAKAVCGSDQKEDDRFRHRACRNRKDLSCHGNGHPVF
jgi:phosphate starvation-inducible PhoH-like protein